MTEDIGKTAGIIWECLGKQKTPITLTTLKKEVSASSTILMMALGWLAREGKINIDISDESFSYKISIKH
ncbi:MAG: winged helix-turn-helix domain-containing protein [Candidatus Poribacteria bacterium]